jgi:predicted Fe-Mo cluster-binding NifX family protein
MTEEKEDKLEEAKELFKEGLIKIFQATKKATEKVVEGFREGYAKDVTKKE